LWKTIASHNNAVCRNSSRIARTLEDNIVSSSADSQRINTALYCDARGSAQWLITWSDLVSFERPRASGARSVDRPYEVKSRDHFWDSTRELSLRFRRRDARRESRSRWRAMCLTRVWRCVHEMRVSYQNKMATSAKERNVDRLDDADRRHRFLSDFRRIWRLLRQLPNDKYEIRNYVDCTFISTRYLEAIMLSVSSVPFCISELSF